MSETPFIRASGLQTFYGESHVLRGVDLTLAPGEALGLMGRNGMGKTTLLRTLLGLTRCRDGEIVIAGERMTGAAPDRIARAGLAYVPEGRGIFPNLSVHENLVMAARPGPAGRRDWTLDRVLATFPRLAERLAHGGTQLSGGEQQMLSIGRALMTNPLLLILDEATEGLAPLVRRELWTIIETISATGIATILVDKNHAAVTRIARRAMILVKGQVLFDGTSADLNAQPDMLQRHLGV